MRMYKAYPTLPPECCLTGCQENELLCCCCWTKEPGTGDPLICQAGTSGLIKILNVKSGQLVKASKVYSTSSRFIYAKNFSPHTDFGWPWRCANPLVFGCICPSHL